MDQEKRAAIGPWQAIGFFVLCWLAAAALGPLLRAAVTPHPVPSGLRDIVAWRTATGLPISWLVLGATVVILKARGRTLRDLGWDRPAPIWGWLAAAAVTAFFLFNSFRVPGCRGLCFIDPHAWATDWSLFRTLTSAAIGVTAGICEETMFRGFVMGQARDGGAPWPLQALLSGALFGIAHLGVSFQ
jgi:membrane protease YdiL (CAAX protease family)